MARLVYVKEAKDKGRVRLGISGVNDEDCTSDYSISAITYSHIGELPCGTELDEDVLCVIISEDEQYRAMKKALSLLAYSDKNRSALYIRLIQCGYSRESAAAAVEECMHLGYIDEHRQLCRLVLNEANVSLRGPVLILRKLVNRGYRADDVHRVISELLEAGEISFEDNFNRLAEKRGASSEEELSALRYKFGYRR